MEVEQVTQLTDIEIKIKERILVFHSLGYFEITKKQLNECLDNKGNILVNKVKELFNERYHPRHWAT